MPSSCLESTEPGTSVPVHCKARIPTGRADKEKQAPQILHESLAFGGKSFPDLHLANFQTSSTVGDLVSSLKVGPKPPGSKPWCLHYSCCNDMEPEPTACWGIWVVVAPQRYRHIAVSSPPACHPTGAPWLRWWRGQALENLGQAWGCSLPPIPILPTAPGKRKREKGGREKSEGHLSQSWMGHFCSWTSWTKSITLFPDVKGMPQQILSAFRYPRACSHPAEQGPRHSLPSLTGGITLLTPTRPTWALQTLLREAFLPQEERKSEARAKSHLTVTSPPPLIYSPM